MEQKCLYRPNRLLSFLQSDKAQIPNILTTEQTGDDTVTFLNDPRPEEQRLMRIRCSGQSCDHRCVCVCVCETDIPAADQ